MGVGAAALAGLAAMLASSVDKSSFVIAITVVTYSLYVAMYAYSGPESAPIRVASPTIYTLLEL